MDLLCVWFAAVPLLVPVSGTTIFNVVSAVEGGSAVLPCNFTYNPAHQNRSFTTMWFQGDLRRQYLIANCTTSSAGHSQCNEMTRESGGGRIRFVGNFSQRDVSIMVEGLRHKDGGRYLCSVQDLTGNLMVKLTSLIVRATGEHRSAVTGTEGTSVILLCVFPTLNDIVTHTVTWMRKDPYRHIITFRLQANGSWAAENGTTRYKLLGDPEQGNASTRVNQLNMQDSHSYLCLVDSVTTKSKIQHLFQCEVLLLVTRVTEFPPITMLWFCLLLGLKTLALFVMCIVLCRDRLRKEEI